MNITKNFESYNNNANFLVIGVTNRCNMRCPWCIASQKLDKIDDEFNEKFKSNLEMLLNINKFYTISLTGGEPLLYKDRIKYIYDTTLLHYSGDFKYTFQINTNGTLLDDDYISLFNETKTKIQLSIQGRYGIKSITDLQSKSKNFVDNVNKLDTKFIRYVILHDNYDYLNDILTLIEVFQTKISLCLDLTNIERFTLDDYIHFLFNIMKLQDKLGNNFNKYVELISSNDTFCNCNLNEKILSCNGEIIHKDTKDIIISGCTGFYLKSGYDKYKIFRYICDIVRNRNFWDGKIYQLIHHISNNKNIDIENDVLELNGNKVEVR